MICHVAVPDLCWHHYINTGVQRKCSSNCILRRGRLLPVGCYGPFSYGKPLTAGSVVSAVQPIQHTETSPSQAKTRTGAALRLTCISLFPQLNRPRTHHLLSQGKHSIHGGPQNLPIKTLFTGLNSHFKTYIQRTHKTLIPLWSETQEKFPRRLVTLMWNHYKEGLTVVAIKVLCNKDNCTRLSLQHSRAMHRVSREGHERLQMFQSFRRDIVIEKQKKGHLVSAC